MTVHFIGAGPGDPELLTVRGLRLIRSCPVCLFAGSLVPRAVVAEAPAGAQIVDTADLDLDAIVGLMQAAHAAGRDVARIHSGDPSIYGALAEQMRRLDRLGIPYDVTPGVPAFAAAAAALKAELTIPGLGQTVILTRVPAHPEALPAGEDLARLGASGATLVLHLAVRQAAHIARTLLPFYGPDCPAVVAWRVSWPEERILRCRLCDLADRIGEAGIDRTALILIGPVLEKPVLGGDRGEDSRLYAKERLRDA